MEVDINDLIFDKDIISYNIPTDSSVYFANLIGEPDLESDKIVYFATNTDDQNWYVSKTNRSKLVRKLSKEKKSWIYVIEDKRQLTNKNNYYILVDSVNLYIDRITKRKLTNSDLGIIAITGSVGKTTLARILSAIIATSQLIDVKRLTPLNLADFVFNKLNPSTKYIIAEVGLYYSGQVAYLANILSPHIGVITNIYDMHIGWNNITNKSAVLTDKFELLKASEIRIVSQEVFQKYAESHLFNQNSVLYSKKKYVDSISSCKILPKTNVSINVLELTSIILSKCGGYNEISDSDICQHIQENRNILRLHKYNTDNNEIFVDSHSSIAGYFQAMSHHLYNSVTLIILSLNFPIEENTEKNIALIKKTFQYYSKVCIYEKLKRYFGQINTDKTIYISENDFLIEIKNRNIVVIHDPKAVRYSKKNGKEWRALTTAST